MGIGTEFKNENLCLCVLKKIARLYRDAYTGFPKQAGTLFAVQVVNASGFMVIFFLSLYLTNKLGFTLAQAGRTISIFGIGSLLGAGFGGWLSDNIGSTNVQKISLLLAGIFYIALGQLNSLWIISIVILIIGSTSGMFYPSTATSMARLCPNDIVPKGFALNRLAGNIGVTIGPAVGGFLALHNYKLLFWTDGLTCLAAVILFSLLWRKPELQLRTEEAKRPISGRSPWRDRPFLLTLPLVILWGMIFHQLFATFPIYMREVYGFPESRIGLLVMINTLLIIAFEMLLIHWIGKHSMLRYIGIAFLLTGLGYSLMPFGRGFPYAAFTVMVWTFGEMLSLPLLGAFLAQRAGPGSQGKYMGLFSLAFSVSLILGPAAGSYIYTGFSPDFLWFGCGILGVVLFVLFRFLVPSLEKARDAELDYSSPAIL